MSELWRRFWFEGEERSRAAVFRVVFFALLAVDAWNQVEHASRYGAGLFNVSHFPALDAWLPMPRASWVLVGTITQAWLALRVAFGVNLRGSLAALTALFGWTYFSSQLDSYQHHYLVFLLLLICTAGVWLEARAPNELPGWCLRLLRVQFSALYLWAAIAKIDAKWISGETLKLQISPQWARDAVTQWAQSLDVQPLSLYAAASVAALALELVLAVAWQRPKLWRWIFVPGVLFHLSIERLDFEIGLFSWFMVAAYLLVLPDGLADPIARLGQRLVDWSAGRLPDAPSWGARSGAALFVALGALMLPIDGSAALAGLLAALALLTPAGVRGATLQGLALLGVLALHENTDALRDHYRYMGGDARRRGDYPTAIHAYERAVALDPDYASARLRLGDLYFRADQPQAALASWRAALDLEPDNVDALQRIVAMQQRLGSPDPDLTRRLRALNPKDAAKVSGDGDSP